MLASRTTWQRLRTASLRPRRKCHAKNTKAASALEAIARCTLRSRASRPSWFVSKNRLESTPKASEAARASASAAFSRRGMRRSTGKRLIIQRVAVGVSPVKKK